VGRRGDGSWRQESWVWDGLVDMCRTCLYAWNMSKMIQVRDVPDRVHSALKSRAAREGMSLSDFIKRELERTAERPTMQEWLERTEHAKPIPTKKTAAQVIRELREER
jgi:antitoxin FitA